jgi:ribonucleoside-diphosphate reductase alpha chain
MYEPQGFSAVMFKKRYTFNDTEIWGEACRRVAHQMALAEDIDKISKYEEKFFEELSENRFVPGGRIWYNSGRPNPQLLNCFVLDDKLDSAEGWGNISKEMIITSMKGGGCGIDFSDVRPAGASIHGHKGTAPGPVELMKLVNGSGEPIRAGGSRRVALMFSLNLHHPNIMEFLNEKLKKNVLKMANISVRSKFTTKFIDAIKNDAAWPLSWKNQYKTEVRAKALWEQIVENAWNCAEPGFLNWELAQSESTISYIEDLVTTNPCGEIWLSKHESCCLGHLVLTRFVKNGVVDWEAMGDTIRTAVRFLDNVLTVNHFPLPEMKTKAHNLRRLGLGTTGLADMLAMLGFRYGDEKGNKFIDKLYRFISKQAYESSIMLAVEKGQFPLCKPAEHVKTGYVKRMTPKIKSLLLEHGIRNCALLTIAPTGTVSIISGNCSAGIEPIYSAAYERRFWDGDSRKTELVFHPLFKEFMEAGESVDHFVGAMDLTAREHMEVQKVIQNHVDNAVSKTINLAEDYSIEDMSKVWLEYLPYLKGTTFYRNNSRKFIDENGHEEEPPLKALTLDEARQLYEAGVANTENQEEHQCKGGVCSL